MAHVTSNTDVDSWFKIHLIQFNFHGTCCRQVELGCRLNAQYGTSLRPRVVVTLNSDVDLS